MSLSFFSALLSYIAFLDPATSARPMRTLKIGHQPISDIRQTALVLKLERLCAHCMLVRIPDELVQRLDEVLRLLVGHFEWRAMLVRWKVKRRVCQCRRALSGRRQDSAVDLCAIADGPYVWIDLSSGGGFDDVEVVVGEQTALLLEHKTRSKTDGRTSSCAYLS